MSRPLPALISIHDVMPETLDRVEEQIDHILARDLKPITLLVVPGRGWKKKHIKRLKSWLPRGCELAGHGWSHRVRVEKRTLYHKFHSAVLSRDAAEHLSLPARTIATLIKRNFEWFGENDLPSPQTYVPPAWGMGTVTRRTLRRMPYRYYEFLHGIYDSEARKEYLLPLAGYEADTQGRVAGVRTSNTINEFLCATTQRPIRLGLHPYDFELLMQDEARGFFDQPIRALGYGEFPYRR